MNIIVKILLLFLFFIFLINISIKVFNTLDPWAGIGAGLLSVAFFVWACFRIGKKAIK